MRGDQRHRVVTIQEWRHDMALGLWWLLFTGVVIGLAVAADLGGWLA